MDDASKQGDWAIFPFFSQRVVGRPNGRPMSKKSFLKGERKGIGAAAAAVAATFTAADKAGGGEENGSIHAEEEFPPPFSFPPSP